jgi:hypothetical protein
LKSNTPRIGLGLPSGPGASHNDVRRGYGAGVLAGRPSDDEGEQFNGSKTDD